MRLPHPEITQVHVWGRTIDMLRLDTLPVAYNGNKWYKLKYNLEEARKTGKTLLTFGGAYSNHIHATAAACKEQHIPAIGLIRGEPGRSLNPTLQFAHDSGMQLHFLSRTDYRRRQDPQFLQALESRFGSVFIVPEGGSNAWGLQGASEILEGVPDYDFVCCPVGTGGTMIGLINGSKSTILGFQVVKDPSVAMFIQSHAESDTWTLIESHLGGYAKFNDALVEFINRFHREQKVRLDPVYTGKMMWTVSDLVKADYFSEHAKILCVHTGGLQGISGFNQRFGHLLD